MDVGHFKLLLQPLNYLIVAKEPGRYQSSDILKNWLLYLQAQGGFSLIKKSKKKKKILMVKELIKKQRNWTGESECTELLST